MNTKRKFIFGLFLLIVALLVYMVTAASPYGNEVLSGHNIVGGMNVSKQINLTALFFDSNAPPSSANSTIENVTFIFELTSNNSQWNITWNNVSANQTAFGGVYNVTGHNNVSSGLSQISALRDTVADGVYNLSIRWCSNITLATANCYQNDSAAVTVTVDSAVPIVNPVALVSTAGNESGKYLFTSTTYNVTFNTSIRDLTIHSGPDAQQPGLVNLRFDNATGADYNVTLYNMSGYWSATVNVSALSGGYHTVTIVANDTAKNYTGSANTNTTQTWTFFVNQPQNLSFDPTFGSAQWGLSLKGATNVSALRTPGGAYDLNDPAFQYLDNANRTQFNITFKNATTATASGAHFAKVIFMFNNGTDNLVFNGTAANGTAYNITGNASVGFAGTSNYVGGALMANITSVNLSYHRAGLNEVCAYLNDSRGFFNKTACITFELNTAPNVTWPLYNALAGDVAQYGKLQGQNFSAVNTTIYFNASVKKVLEGFNGINITNVIFMFDNATGTDFNISNASRVGGVQGQQIFNASYNVSALAEGTHTVTLFTNDYFANHNKTESLTFKVDKTGPAITVTCTSNPTVGSTVTCTCAATDSLTGVKEAAVFSGDTDNSESTTATGSGGTSSTCVAYDWTGNKGTGTGTWTTTAAESSGGGSGGGGGGSGTGGTTTTTTESTTPTTETTAPSTGAGTGTATGGNVITSPQQVYLGPGSGTGGGRGSLAGQASGSEVLEVTVAVKKDVPITFTAPSSTESEVEYELTVEEVTETSATISLTSGMSAGATGSAVDVVGAGSLRLTLNVGDVQEVDTDGDGVSDLQVRLNSVNPADQYADVTVTSLISAAGTSTGMVVLIVALVVLVLAGAYWMLRKK